MRAKRENNNNNKKDNRIELKNIGLSIALHVAVAALVVGVGKSEGDKHFVKEDTSPMKAVLWVSTGVKEKTDKPQLSKPVNLEKKSVVEETLPKKQGLNPGGVLETSENIVKIPKETKKAEEDPWIDELLSLEPLVQPYGEGKESTTIQDEKRRIVPAVEKVIETVEPGIKRSTLEPKPPLADNKQKINEQPIVARKEKKAQVENNEGKEEAYVDPYFAYRLTVAKHIQSKWRADSALSGSMCEIDISIMRDGTILMLHSLNGNSQVCDSAKMAIKRIKKLPSSPSDAVFEKLKRMSVRLTVR